jgi:hypothetical protein
VKYAIDGAVYLNAGRNAGLTEGMKLVIKRPGNAPGQTAQALPTLAEVVISSVAGSSAVCDVVSASADLRRGDVAYLSAESAQQLAELRAAKTARKYPQTITFTEGDPLDEEARDAVPKPPLPEINRARGRIGVEYSSMRGRSGFAGNSTQVGLVLRSDITRIGGTYWNLSGYWRGRLNSRSGTEQDTLTDLMNRTYHLSLTYANPNSRWVAGFGRLQLPWASSLDTLDGGYGGRRLGKLATLGIFAGSTPDPSSWNYNPDRRIAGAFANFEGGSFDRFRFTSTTGVAVSSILWRAERQFLFTENGLFYKQIVALYQSLQADAPRRIGNSTTTPLSRSYTTLRLQPHPRLAFDISHNYFRDLPTFDPRLVSTGLVDKLLFQGMSAGVRVELPKRTTVYSSLGRSARSGDTRRSLNQMYGITFGNVFRTGIRADARYSSFDGSFGRGNYRSVSLSRNFGDSLRWEVQGGQQNFTSVFTHATHSQYLMSTIDASLGTHFFLQGGVTLQRGDMQAYDQWFMSLGYRFDSRGNR